MADYIFEAQTPNDSGFDGQWHTLGVLAAVSADANVIGGRVWFPSATPVNFEWLIYRVSDQAIIAHKDLSTIAAPINSAWNEFTSAEFTAPGDVPLSTTEQYIVAFATDGDFVFNNAFAYPIGPGIITASEGRFFDGGAGPTFPPNSTATLGLFADALAEQVVEPSTGTAEFQYQLELTVEAPTAQGTAALEYELEPLAVGAQGGIVTTPSAGPCESWSFICADGLPENPTSEEQQLIDQTAFIATEILWNRTKRRFGTCELTLRPCRAECWPSSMWGSWLPFWRDASSWSWPFPTLVGGTWINLGCGSCTNGCSCSVVSEAVLPYPVAEIVEVRIDGEVLSPFSYRVDNHRLLVRVDGLDWPRCNDLSKSDLETGTWSVTALYGTAVPELGQLAMGQLVSAIFKACTGAKDCPLPVATIREITRQGVKKVFFDANEAFKRGKIGLYYPDLFIHTYNPSGTGVASIFDIDGPRRRTTTIHPGGIPG